MSFKIKLSIFMLSLYMPLIETSELPTLPSQSGMPGKPIGHEEHDFFL
jgi:hypothetical protein